MLNRVITYHYNGNIREEYYVDSSRMKQGEYKAYHDNGKLVKYSFYINGNEVDVSIHGMDINNLTEDDMNLLTVIYA